MAEQGYTTRFFSVPFKACYYVFLDYVVAAIFYRIYKKHCLFQSIFYIQILHFFYFEIIFIYKKINCMIIGDALLCDLLYF